MDESKSKLMDCLELHRACLQNLFSFLISKARANKEIEIDIISRSVLENFCVKIFILVILIWVKWHLGCWDWMKVFWYNAILFFISFLAVFLCSELVVLVGFDHIMLYLKPCLVIKTLVWNVWEFSYSIWHDWTKLVN